MQRLRQPHVMVRDSANTAAYGGGSPAAAPVLGHSAIL